MMWRAGLYGMVDLSAGPPSLTRLELTRALLAGGCRVLQLRMKGVPSGARLAVARTLRPMVEEAGACLIINDDLEVALRLRAEGAVGLGLHLGQTDGPLARARSLLGPAVVIGRSTHTLAQASQAWAEGADYIGFGPVYSAATKGTDDAPVGVTALGEVIAQAPRPVVAIGGIALERAQALRAVGVRHVACIGDVNCATDIPERVRAWAAALGQAAG